MKDVGHVRVWDKPSSVQQWANKQSIAVCNHILYLNKMTKAHAFRFSLSDTHTNVHTQKPAQLVTFVLKVPVRMDQFSNLQWQQGDWCSWRQTRFNTRILPVLMSIIMKTFRFVEYVFVKLPDNLVLAKLVWHQHSFYFIWHIDPPSAKVIWS